MRPLILLVENKGRDFLPTSPMFPNFIPCPFQMNVNLLNAQICISSEGLSALITFIAFERPKGLAIELRLPDPIGICLDEETKGIKWKLLLVQKKKKKKPKK